MLLQQWNTLANGQDTVNKKESHTRALLRSVRTMGSNKFFIKGVKEVPLNKYVVTLSPALHMHVFYSHIITGNIKVSTNLLAMYLNIPPQMWVETAPSNRKLNQDSLYLNLCTALILTGYSYLFTISLLKLRVMFTLSLALHT